MSCFVVPLAQAVATTICRRVFKDSNASIWKAQLPALEKMLWGGSLVLLVDHIAHGELLAFNLKEMLTVGIPMSVVVTAVWAIMVLVKSPSPSPKRQSR